MTATNCGGWKITYSSRDEAETAAAFQRVSKEVVLCVDSSKLGQQSLAAGFPLDAVSVLITELDPDDSRLDPFRDQVEVR